MAESKEKFRDLTLSPQEKIIKSYQCSRLAFPRTDGYLTITNQRVIFHGEAGNSFVIEEIQLPSISGFSSFFGYRLNPLMLVVGLALLIACIPLSQQAFSRFSSQPYYYSNAYSSWLGFFYLLLTVGALIGSFLLLKRCRMPRFHFQIYSSQATGSPINIGGTKSGLFGNTALYSLVGNPTHQTKIMLLELGALIGDVQKMGDRAIDRWLESETPQNHIDPLDPPDHREKTTTSFVNSDELRAVLNDLGIDSASQIPEFQYPKICAELNHRKGIDIDTSQFEIAVLNANGQSFFDLDNLVNEINIILSHPEV